MLGLCAGLSHGPPGKEAAAGPSFNCPKKHESKSQTQIAIEIPCNNEEEHPALPSELRLLGDPSFPPGYDLPQLNTSCLSGCKGPSCFKSRDHGSIYALQG